MTFALLSCYFQDEFVPIIQKNLVSVGLKCSLLFDKTTSHSMKNYQLKSSDGNIKCVCFSHLKHHSCLTATQSENHHNNKKLLLLYVAYPCH